MVIIIMKIITFLSISILPLIRQDIKDRERERWGKQHIFYMYSVKRVCKSHLKRPPWQTHDCPFLWLHDCRHIDISAACRVNDVHYLWLPLCGRLCMETRIKPDTQTMAYSLFTIHYHYTQGTIMLILLCQLGGIKTIYWCMGHSVSNRIRLLWQHLRFLNYCQHEGLWNKSVQILCRPTIFGFHLCCCLCSGPHRLGLHKWIHQKYWF